MLVAAENHGTVQKPCFWSRKPAQPRIIADHLGSIRVTLDQSGNIDSWTDYYPFGKVARDQNSSNKPKEGFTNYQHDVELDLDYAGARFYNAALGRFTSVDPMLQFPSPYVYSGNDPIRYFDPSGMSARYLWGDDMGHSDDYVESVLHLRENMNPEDRRKKDERDWRVGDEWWKTRVPRNNGGLADIGNGRSAFDSQNGDDPPGSESQDGPAHNGDNNIYIEREIPFFFSAVAYLLAEGGGLLNGSFNVQGTVSVKNGPSGTTASISARGYTPAAGLGDVTFFGDALLLANGRIISSKSFSLNGLLFLAKDHRNPVGYTSFNLPTQGKIQIGLRVSYMFNDGGQGVSPLRFINKTIDIPSYTIGSIRQGK